MLKTSRMNLLLLYTEPSSDTEIVQKEFQTYLSLLMGFINDYSGRSTGDSKLRYSIKPKWTQSLGSTYI